MQKKKNYADFKNAWGDTVISHVEFATNAFYLPMLYLLPPLTKSLPNHVHIVEQNSILNSA